MPLKYSACLNFLLNSFTSSDNSCVLPNFGVGVNFSPLFNNNISASVSFLFEKFIILMSLLIMFISDGVCFLVLGPGYIIYRYIYIYRNAPTYGSPYIYILRPF